MLSHFSLLKLPEQFAINTDILEQHYRTLAAQFHPDKFATASSFEQKQAMMMSATLNEAYRTLINPLDRAAYLLQQHGINPDAPEHTHFAPEFLMQQMQWRETLMDAQSSQDHPTLQTLQHTIQSEQNQIYQQLQTSFAQQDHEHAAELVRQGRFLAKLIHEIAQSLP